jgi:uncharacterized membrane-anchored protein YitT (DUF2179 family)
VINSRKMKVVVHGYEKCREKFLSANIKERITWQQWEDNFKTDLTDVVFVVLKAI